MAELYMKSCDGHEVEVCPNCMNEIELRWDINKDGFQAYCPVCGERLMLCDACHHRYGDWKDDCDYNNETNTCRFSRPKDWWVEQDERPIEKNMTPIGAYSICNTVGVCVYDVKDEEILAGVNNLKPEWYKLETEDDWTGFWIDNFFVPLDEVVRI